MFPDEPPKRVMVCYSIFQPIYEVLKSSDNDIVFKQGLPTKKEMMLLGGDDYVEHSILYIDDFMGDVCDSKNMEELFVSLAHHHKITCLF